MKTYFAALLFFLAGLSFASGATRNAHSSDYGDVNPAVNGGPDSTGFVWNGKANDGDTVIIPAGTPSTWPSQLTVTKNIKIIGAGAGATTISGGNIFNITADGTPHLVQLSGMTLTETGGGVPLTVGGFAPINDSDIQNSGIRIDHVVFNGTAANTGGYTMIFTGWLEGVMDHVILDHDITKHLGETIIINHSSSPTGTGHFGDYSWCHAYTPATIHQLIGEDCIFHRSPGGVDSNQFNEAGGGRITFRHCTGWGHLASGHGGFREGVRTTGPRCEEGYKNLVIRSSTQGDQSSDFFTIRSGEAYIWGNRSNRPGSLTNQGANSPLGILNYGVETIAGNTSWPPADGTGGFDENQKGSFTWLGNPVNVDSGYSNGSVTNGVDSASEKGDVYAHGTGGSSNGLTVTPTGLNFHGGGNYWQGFVIRNLARPLWTVSPASFAYIVTSSATSLSVGPSHPSTPPAGAQFTLAAGEAWEIRKVKTYMGVAGSGTWNDPFGEVLDSSATGAISAGKGAKLTGIQTPNPRWAVNEAPGAWQWDNKYRTDMAASFSAVQPWNQDTTNSLTCRNVHNDPDTPPGGQYPYTAGTAAGSAGPPEVRPDTRVGADAEAWSIAPSDIPRDSSTVSVYAAGSGGYTYPHPLVVSGPIINSAPTATFSTTSSGTFNVTTNGFTGTPTITETGSLPSGVTLTTGGLLSGTPGGGAASYPITITATYSPASQTATQSFNLIVVSPNLPPTVSITAPPNASFFVTTDTVPIQATASDPDGSITSVSFYSDNVLIGTLTTAPYAFNWTNSSSPVALNAGTHVLKAIATDNFGSSTTSGTISITVATASSAPPPPANVVIIQ